MTDASKILKVSYGNFSCTLEGFDDPLNTMKAIAEYFRDLTAENRYFGAEPPTPDAAMLHKIAERDIQRRVEAKISGSNVSLRAEHGATPRVTFPAMQPIPQPAPHATAPVLATAFEAAPAIQSAVKSAVESAAARLFRLRAAQAGPVASTYIEAYTQDPLPEDEAANAYSGDDSHQLAARPQTIEDDLPETADLIAEADQFEAAAFAAETEAESGVEAETASKALPADQTADQPEETEPAPILIAPADQLQVVAQVVAQTPEVMAEPLKPITSGPAEVTMSAPVVAEKLMRARARVSKIRGLGTVQPVDAAEPDVIARPTDVPPPVFAEPASDLSAQAEADLQTELAALEAELNMANPVTAALDLAAGQTPLAADAAFDDAEAESDAPPQLILSEPHRLPTAETDEASVNRLLEKTNSELEAPETKRRRYAIAHLKAAVTATVAERRIHPNNKPDLRMDPYRADLHKVVRQPERAAPLVLVSSQRIIRTPDDASRPPPQAVPQGAAASTSIQPVRPRRVTLAHSAAQPLSIDDEDDATDGVKNIFNDPGKQTFQQFTDSLNATSLTELIEAAGAYRTLVLGHESFTRPQLFQHIQSLAGQPDLLREDGLRSFSRLIRDGRMTKTKSGHYVLAATSPILTKARWYIS